MKTCSIAAVAVLAAAASVAAQAHAGGGKADRRHAARAVAPSPLARVAAANRSSTREPTRSGYVNAAQVYPWIDGSLYRLYAAPGEVSDIALEPGEAVISVAAGDTVRWVIGDTASGMGIGRQVHILVKPTAPDLATNMVIATDRRVYHLALASNGRTGMVGVSWTYPADALLALRGGPAASVATGLDPAALDFGYAIEGDHPSWRPLRAFDDGRQVYIEFPPTLAAGEAPPLFVRGDKGTAELVNYRLRGRYYVVDRLFAAAELRIGGKHQQVVRIVRRAADRARRGS